MSAEPTYSMQFTPTVMHTVADDFVCFSFHHVCLNRFVTHDDGWYYVHLSNVQDMKYDT